MRSEQNEKAAFRRMGYALKLGYEGKAGTLSGSIFYAKDDANSLTPIPSGTLITPKQNIAVNFKAKKVFFKKLSAELAAASGVRPFCYEQQYQSQYQFNTSSCWCQCQS